MGKDIYLSNKIINFIENGPSANKEIFFQGNNKWRKPYSTRNRNTSNTEASQSTHSQVKNYLSHGYNLNISDV